MPVIETLRVILVLLDELGSDAIITPRVLSPLVNVAIEPFCRVTAVVSSDDVQPSFGNSEA